MVFGSETWGCAKYGCRHKSVTVELEVGVGAETFPNALCAEHARRPDKKGTLLEPTQVLVREFPL